MKKTSLLLLPCVFLLTSCFKTAEQIKREEMMDSMAVQMVDNQKLTSDVNQKIQSMEERLANLAGELETTGHNVKSSSEERFKSLEADLKIVKEQFSKLDQNYKVLESSMLEQKQYLEEVLKVLSDLSKAKPEKKGKADKAQKKSPFEEAVAQYRAKDYKAAKPALSELVSKKALKKSEMTDALFFLGMISYDEKNYQDALVYFSKLFTDYPNSVLNANGLLHMARSFAKLKQNEQAEQAYETFIEKYPKSKHLAAAKKELEALN